LFWLLYYEIRFRGSQVYKSTSMGKSVI
jgi:hypothetical protein